VGHDVAVSSLPPSGPSRSLDHLDHLGPLDAFGPRSWTRPEAIAFGREHMLDGPWRFAHHDRPEAVTRDHLTGSTEDWPEVDVPGCWTMQGYDAPHYTNTDMPFPGPPPHVPDRNPTGTYRRRVAIPADWDGRRIVLHVGGAESVLYVHIDGRPVAFGKDSRLPHDIDLTDHVTAGTSAELALTVVRWSDATYLEDQDHWYHAGLHRSVCLDATPPVYLADLHAVADLDPATGDGRLSLRAVVEALGLGPTGWTVRASVAGHTASAAVAFEHPTDGLHNWLMFGGRGAELAIDVPGVAPWSAESPSLHRLEVELIDEAGNVVDTAGIEVGFRRVEIVGHELLVNGRPVLIKGVNRHDHDPRRGKAVTREGIEADLVAMKRHNINAVRTSHYPNDPFLYEACDRLGLYVVDEADLETHAYLRSLTKDPRWTAAIMERVVRMALRDKNHPSIICWSIGNESGSAPALRAASEWLRGYDPSRPIQYEGSIGEGLFGDLAAGIIPDVAEVFRRPAPETDIAAPMYPSVDDLVSWATGSPPDRPLIMCEYIHAMNNSCGGLDRYWEAIRTYPGLQGGFVWDWVDQALVQTLPDGSERLAYGGDFGDEPNDGPFCLNGLVAADRTPHPSLLELAKVIQPVQLHAVDPAAGLIRIVNEQDFTDLSWLEGTWSLAVDGVEVATDRLGPIEVAPGEATEVAVAFPAPTLGPGQLAHLTVSFATAADRPWAEAGHVVAWEQFEVGRGAGPSEAPTASPAPTARTALALDALEPRLALWRAPIDNETFGPTIGWRHAARWEHLQLRTAAERIDLRSEVTGDSSGRRVAHEVTVPDDLDDIARVGVRLCLGAGVDRVEWLGDGPHEGYSDRRCGTRLGRWTTAIDDWPVPYVHPQASGNRTGVRWLRFLAADGTELAVIDELDDLDVTVSRWTDEQVADAGHLEDLPQVDECWVWLDARHRGVGSAAVGPDVAPDHQVGAGTYRWSYRLR
jgi:beta-galactosidase